MNKLWQQLAIATNWPVLAAVAVLCALGIISIWADKSDDAIRQIIFMTVGVILMIVCQVIDYRNLGRFAWGFYVVGLLLILYTVMGSKIALPFTHPIKGQSNWITFGRFSLQPAELMKVAFVMTLARYLRFRSNYRTIRGLLPPFILSLIPLAFIMKQPDLGTALVFIPILFIMLFAAGAKLSHLFAIVLLGLLVAPLLWFSGSENVAVLRHFPELVKRYQRDRVYAMFHDDPETLREVGFQAEHSLMAIGSGGLLGKGFGNIPVGKSVPEAHNDMIFALVCEQFGLIGAVAVLGAYIVLFAAGIEIAGSTREPFGRLVAVGVVAMLAGQTFINLMVAVKFMPVTGITLPFVSYGGSSLLASFIAAGLLLNIGQNRPIVMAREAFEF